MVGKGAKRLGGFEFRRQTGGSSLGRNPKNGPAEGSLAILDYVEEETRKAKMKQRELLGFTDT